MEGQDHHHHYLLEGYRPPTFWKLTKQELAASGSLIVPTHKLKLIPNPTPIEPFFLPELPEDAPALYLKRDDLTGGVESSGNKTRKLEFLLADALLKRSTHIITAGGTQSNHVRQTAAACARLGLPLDAVIRNDSPGTNGNVLLNTLLGAKLHFFDARDLNAQKYNGLTGRTAALQRIADAVSSRSPPGNPYVIPVGGSNALGTWGYIDFMNELTGQSQSYFGCQLHHRIGSIVCAVGSGGTVCGLGVGAHLYNKALKLGASLEGEKLHVRGYGVCDSPEAFYADINRDLLPHLLPNVGTKSAPVRAEELMTLVDAKGIGYAKSTTEELQFLSLVSRSTGVIFDRCYTGKAVLGLWKSLQDEAKSRASTGQPPRKGIVASQSGSGRGVLFVHTGGSASIFDAASEYTGAASKL
jgi:D-cysteine desulfhydrase